MKAILFKIFVDVNQIYQYLICV